MVNVIGTSANQSTPNDAGLYLSHFLFIREGKALTGLENLQTGMLIQSAMMSSIAQFLTDES